MEKAIVIRHGEIHLKGKNIGIFENQLVENIKKALFGLDFNIVRLKNRYCVEGFNQPEQIISRLKKVFGIHSLSVATKVQTSIDNIFLAAQELVEGSGTFRVTTNRADKRFALTSMELSSRLGAMLLKSCKNLSVDLHNPCKEICVDLREDGVSFVYCGIVKGAGGLPVGTSAGGLVLLSGGIDSPVSAYMMAKRGMVLHALHFHSYPHTSLAAQDKVKQLARAIKPYTMGMRLHFASLTPLQEAINKYANNSYLIALTRKYMMRIACRLAQEQGLHSIITGESLGQVASQTLESLTVTESEASIPVLRPLIGFDKNEIIDIAKKIGTYDISIQPYEDCCTVFLPQKPVIKPTLARVLEEESRIKELDELVEQVVQSICTVEY